MHASLPMYDFASVRDATDRYWQAIRKELGCGPDALCREGTVWQAWAHPDLLLSQTCGMPYRGFLQGKVTLVGTPDYGLPGCGAGEYNSVFFVRGDDSRNSLAQYSGATFALNSTTSQSGWAGPILHARGQGVSFGNFTKTGSHLASAQAVADGAADIAGLDALSWHYIQRETSLSENLRVIDHTSPTPGLPYVTSLTREPGALFESIERAIQKLSKEDRSALCLRGIVKIGQQEYSAVPTPAPPTL